MGKRRRFDYLWPWFKIQRLMLSTDIRRHRQCICLERSSSEVDVFGMNTTVDDFDDEDGLFASSNADEEAPEEKRLRKWMTTMTTMRSTISSVKSQFQTCPGFDMRRPKNGTQSIGTMNCPKIPSNVAIIEGVARLMLTSNTWTKSRQIYSP